MPVSAVAPDWSLLAEHHQSAPADLPVLASVDVPVVGGGPAGVAAATTAAELGQRTLLVEKYGFYGGAAVAGMSGTICGLYLAHDQPSTPPGSCSGSPNGPRTPPG